MDWLGAGVGIIQGLLTQQGGEETNAANAEQAARQMEFQERMSGTSYQRAVKDMEAAGLNPMLAYSQGGASTPGGAMAQMQNALGAGVSSAQVGSKIQPEIDNIRAVTDKTRTDTEKSKAEAELARSQASVNAAMVPKLVADTVSAGHSAAEIESKVERLRRENALDYGGHSVNELAGRSYLRNWEAEAEKYRVRGGYPEHQAREMMERARHEGVRALLSELELPEAKAEAGFWSSDVGKKYPYIERGTSTLGSVLHSAGQGFRLTRPGRTYYRGR